MEQKEQYYNFSQFIQDMTEMVEETDTDSEQVKQAETLLARLIRNKEWLAADIQENNDGANYARHCLYRDPADRFEVLALIWNPGQNTPLHDHDGTWGVEGVINGKMMVENYLQLENFPGDIVKLQYTDTLMINEQSTGQLLPPADCHILRNAGGTPAVTIHVYGKQLKEFRVFEETEEKKGYYKTSRVTVGYTTEKNPV